MPKSVDEILKDFRRKTFKMKKGITIYDIEHRIQAKKKLLEAVMRELPPNIRCIDHDFNNEPYLSICEDCEYNFPYNEALDLSKAAIKKLFSEEK